MSRHTEPDFVMAEILNSRAGQKRTYRAAGNAMAICPVHADTTPSLAIKWQSDRLIYNCYGHCGVGLIFKAIRGMGYDPVTGHRLDGVKMRAMPVTGPKPKSEEEEFKEQHHYDAHAYPNWLKTLWAWPRLTDPTDIRRFVYRDYDGHPLMTVTSYRKENAKGKLKKYFLPRSPWVNNKTGKLFIAKYTGPEPRPPYGAESLVRPGPVFAAEGEKCRDALNYIMQNRFPVISVYGSAPTQADLSKIAGRTLIISRDHDSPGLAYATELQRLHDGPSITIEPPPNVLGKRPLKWDIYDYVVEQNPQTGEKFDRRERALAYLAYLDSVLPDSIRSQIEPYLHRQAA